MRAIGLDLGTKTCGVAISDNTYLLANFLKVIRYDSYDILIKEIGNVINDYNVNEIALGLPKNMNNSLGDRANETLKFKDLLCAKTGLFVTMIDERLSTVEAENMLIDRDFSRKKRKKVIDGVAATIILDSYLKMRKDTK